MRYIIIKIILPAFLISVCCPEKADAQGNTINQELAAIYQKYDSTSYITFNTTYSYTSDTLFNDFTNETLTGTYTINGNQYLCKIGDIEYMQNDSFLVGVYNKDKMIVVGNSKAGGGSMFLPLKGEIDSMIQSYAIHYLITIHNQDSIGKIEFVSTDSIAAFTHFLIKYDVQTHFISSVEYEFLAAKNPPDSLDSNIQEEIRRIKRKQRLKVSFTDYRIDNFSNGLYDENGYIWFEDGHYKGVEKYKDYQVYNTRTTD